MLFILLWILFYWFFFISSLTIWFHLIFISNLVLVLFIAIFYYILNLFSILSLGIWFYFIFMSNFPSLFYWYLLFYSFLIELFFFIPQYFIDWRFHFIIFLSLPYKGLVSTSWLGWWVSKISSSWLLSFSFFKLIIFLILSYNISGFFSLFLKWNYPNLMFEVMG